MATGGHFPLVLLRRGRRPVRRSSRVVRVGLEGRPRRLRRRGDVRRAGRVQVARPEDGQAVRDRDDAHDERQLVGEVCLGVSYLELETPIFLPSFRDLRLALFVVLRRV